MKLIFATQNKNKFAEAQQILGNSAELLSPTDLDFFEELPETHFTLEENAEEKASFIYHRFSQNCFAEDTGLEVEALNGEPGVFSARYAGTDKKAEDNIRLVLDKMKAIENRRAKFRTVVCLIIGEKKYFFSGIMEGKILRKSKGKNGFGYDPVFCPDGFAVSFAEMPSEQKNRISHRFKALAAMKEFLSSK